MDQAAQPALSDAFFHGAISQEEAIEQANEEATKEMKAEWLGRLEALVEDLNQDEADYIRAVLEDSHPVQSDEEILDQLDMRSEIASLVRLTRLLKSKVMTPSGGLRNKVDVPDLKNTATSVIALTKQIKDMRGEIYDQERVRALEKSVTTAMATMDAKAQQQFLDTLQELCEEDDL